MKKVAVVITCLDSGSLAEESLRYVKENSDSAITTLILVDNGSYTPLPKYDADILVRYEKNIGMNAVYHRIIPFLDTLNIDIVAYLHCDFLMREPEWDYKTIASFEKDPMLGLIGFVGSNEIGGDGGRGLGTISAFIGDKYNMGQMSPAQVHGAIATGIHPAAVLDACAMVFSLNVLKDLPKQEDMHTPGHFYDRVMSCEVLRRGYHIAVLGFKCDHMSEGTADGCPNRDEMYRGWLAAHDLLANTADPDVEIYREGERLFLSKWRDELHFIPLRVNPDYSITHLGR